MRITGRWFKGVTRRFQQSTCAGVFPRTVLTYTGCILLVLFLLDSSTDLLATLMRRRQYNPLTDGGIRLYSNVSRNNCSCGRDDGCTSVCSSLQVLETFVWPSNSSENSMQRIFTQHRYVELFSKWLNDRRAKLRQTNSSRAIIKDKIILRVGNFNFYDWMDGRGRFVADNCPTTDCVMTSDTERYRQTADVLIISEINAERLRQYLPKPRHQIWIAQHMESPSHNRLDASVMRDLVNWTASYRRDSTVPFPYYVVRRRNAEDGDSRHDPKTTNVAAGKTRQVAWFVTNLRDHNGRKSYVRELSKYIGVDIYGGGGSLQCDKTKDSCWKMLAETYKFYLAFENSNCHDYITEKLFRNALQRDILPIVMGARPQDYADVAPPHSYIHVDDFRSPRDLADYLRVLDANDTLYNEYFRWKSEWIVTSDRRYWCRMCGLLHAATDPDFRQSYIHWYPDYGTWWNGVCFGHWTMQNGARWKTWNDTTAGV